MLNRAQLLACWALSAVISFLLVYPTIETSTRYKYRSRDGWVWRVSELPKIVNIDEQGRRYLISNNDSDGTKERAYYYEGRYTEYSLRYGYHPYERFILVVVLNGVLLVVSLGSRRKGEAP